MAISIGIDISDLRLARGMIDDIAREYPKVGRDIAKDWGTRVRRYARENASHRIYPKHMNSEDLRNQIHKTTGRNFVVVDAMTSYAGFMETGTKPHFIWSNPIWKRIHINENRPHPGAQGYPIQHFMSRAFHKSMSELKEIAENKMSKIDKIVTKG